MAIKVLPVLNLDGWITEPNKLLDYLFSYYILTDHGQSYLFQNKLKCLSKIYYEHINDPDGFTFALKNDFTSYLESYFPLVEISVKAKQIKNSNGYYVLLSASVSNNDGRRYELTRLTEISTSSMRKVIEINNFGSGIEYLNTL